MGMRRAGTALLVARALRRQVLADLDAVALLGLVVAVAAFGVAVVPRAVDAALTDAVRQTVRDVGPIGRALTGSVIGAPLPATEAAPDAAYQALVRGVRNGPAANLGPAAAVPEWDLTTTDALRLEGPPPRPGLGRHFELAAGSAWPGKVRFVAGTPPRTGVAPPETLRAADAAATGNLAPMLTAPPLRLEVAVSRSAAELMRLAVGDDLLTGVPTGIDLPKFRLVVSGIYEPADPADEFWQLRPSALHPLLGESDLEGTYRTGVVFLGDGALPVLSGTVSHRPTLFRLTVRTDVRAGSLRAEDAGPLAAAIRRATAQSVPVPGAAQSVTGAAFMGFTSDLAEALDAHARRQRPVVALAGVLLAGLLGCAAVVLLLAGRLLLERRRVAVTITAARGASAAQSAGTLALEALAIAVPAAAAGAAIAALVSPGRAGTAAWAMVVFVALLPAVLVPASATPLLGAGRTAVREPRGRRREAVVRRGRGAAGLLLLGVTATAVAALIGRGVGAGTAGGDVDWLVSATPVLVAVSAAVLTFRVVSGPLTGLAGRSAARPGLVGFLGLARATRAAPLGPAAVTALTVALAVTSLAAVTDATLARGTADAARLAVGADLRVTGYGLGPGAQEALGRVPGVRDVTPMTMVRDASFAVVRPGEPTSPDGDTTVTVLAVDPAGLRAVQRDLAPQALPAELEAPAPAGGDQPSTVLPVVVSAGLARSGESLRVRVAARWVRGRVVGAVGDMPGAPPGEDWVMVAASRLRAVTGAVLAPDVLLAAADAPDTAAVGRTLGYVTATTPQSWSEQSTSGALVRAVRSGLPLAAVAGGALAGLALVSTLLAGAASRRRFTGHLRALGLSRGQAGALVLLEVLPVAVVALLTGVVTGTALAWLVLPAAHLRALTGGVAEPAIAAPPAVLLGICAGFAAILLLALLAAVLDQRRVSPAAVARLGDGE